MAREPLAQHRAFFAENIRLNGLDPTTFTIHEQAVGATDGKARFLEQGYGSVLLQGAPDRLLHRVTKNGKAPRRRRYS